MASPCVSVCRLDPERLGCEGCLRTLDEIRAWKTMDNAQRLSVWRQVEARLDRHETASREQAAYARGVADAMRRQKEREGEPS